MSSIHYPKLTPHGSVVRDHVAKKLALYNDNGEVITTHFISTRTEQRAEEQAKQLAKLKGAVSWAFF